VEHSSRVPIVVAVISAVSAIAVAVIAVAWPAKDTPGGAPAPTATGATTPTGQGPAGPATTGGAVPATAGYGESRTFRLTLSAGVFVDLDTESADLDGGPEFEFFYKGDLNNALFFARDPGLYGRSEVALTTREDAGPESCPRSTRPQERTVSGYFMADDDVICMTTSEGGLAVLDVLEWGGTGGEDAVLDVSLWAKE
jgi:hypothetical protein